MTDTATVDGLLRLGTGFPPDERERLVSWLQPLDARLKRYDADRVDLEISVKGRGSERPEVRLIAHVHGRGSEPKVHLVATSTAATTADGSLQDAVLDCRDDLRRQLDDHVTRNEARRRR